MEDKTIELSEEQRELYRATARSLKGHERRVFMARVVKMLGPGGQSQAHRELGWDRDTIRKGMHEVDSGMAWLDAYSARGRKRAEERLPHLLEDLRAIVDGQSQTDPSFKSTRLYTRLSAAGADHAKGLFYGGSAERRNHPGQVEWPGLYAAQREKESAAKKVKETDAIFEQLAHLHAQAPGDPSVRRLSLDAKATVNVGPFSRYGQTRVHLQAADHDFKPEAVLTPYGIFLPDWDETYLYFTESKVTADLIVDCLRDFWLMVRGSFPQVRTLLLNLDNGPENHSRRTQFMARLTALADEFGLTLQLAYYPPYHSKYNPIERVWGVLEQHWNGHLLDSRPTVLRLAATMTYNGFSPTIKVVEKTYQTGIRLAHSLMSMLEKRFERVPGLDKWFVRIVPRQC